MSHSDEESLLSGSRKPTLTTEEKARLLRLIREGWALFSISGGRQCRGRAVLLLDSLDELVAQLAAAVSAGDYPVKSVRRARYAILPARVVEWRASARKGAGQMEMRWSAVTGGTRVQLPAAAVASAEVIAESFAREEKPAELVWRLRRLALRQFLLREITSITGLPDLNAS